MKIYTKSGDSGKTSLASGKRVSKSNVLVDLYGTCDELNSSIGMTIAFLKEGSDLKNQLIPIQNILFELGSELAGFRPKEKLGSVISEEDITFLEQAIDGFQEKLPPLKNFILPGGSKAAAFLQFSRTICRRLERMMVTAQEEQQEIFDQSLIFVNRLSDYLFVAGRTANLEEGIEDIKWLSRTKPNK
ncbi:MAG: cob(I)yrinic acid a,c-diamide adenosyltransferase [Leptospiraceae bacterium]|nr:cob(I)yrinic acid a,c-diamide adenosyltransferase [Leptospiraceae bacterium]MCP5493368.1 cob(I)yrinic acid a,c-diamide adenosyltransferase [Leptospiraceae bacterium]